MVCQVFWELGQTLAVISQMTIDWPEEAQNILAYATRLGRWSIFFWGFVMVVKFQTCTKWRRSLRGYGYCVDGVFGGHRFEGQDQG